MRVTVDSIRAIFANHAYVRTRATAKLDEYRALTTGQYLYFYTDQTLSSSIQVVIHPDLKFEPFLTLPGVSCPKSTEFRHGSNMRQFPKRKHRGERETPYGRAMEIDSLEALTRFLQFLNTPVGSERKGAELPPRLTAIELENFKGVSERVRIELAPITLLFGANSAGKSTILQALQYMREVLERRNLNPDQTLHGGAFVDLGGFRNLVHQRDLTRRIAIKLELELNRASLPDLVPEAFDEWQTNDDSVWEFSNLLQSTRDRTNSVSIELKIGWSSVRQAASVIGYEAGLNGDWLVRIESRDDGRDAEIKVNRRNPVFMRSYTDAEYEENRLLLSGLDVDVIPNEGEKIDDSDDREYSLWPGITNALEDVQIKGPAQGFRQWLTTVDGALPNLEPLLYVPTGDAKGAQAVYIAREFTAFLSTVVVGPGVLMRDYLRKLRYVGPIRNVPPRGFEALLTPNEARWADGTAAWEALLTGDEKLVEKVSSWMADEERLATGYAVERLPYKEIPTSTLAWLIRALDPDSGARDESEILRAIEDIPERRRLVLKDTDTGMSVQARDVGIGISQVLPVVVAALDTSASLVAIEQPELHIHPAVQVGLGDLLIEGAKVHGISFLVETHSEHLILRLLRRIREAASNELPPGMAHVAPDDIHVLFVEKSDSEQVQIHPIGIDENGKFVGRWPRGFFPERMHEALPKEIRDRVDAKRRDKA